MGEVNLLGQNSVGPHSFRPFRWWDALFRNGRCAGCYFPRHGHPMHCWVAARHLHDKTRLSWDDAAKQELRLIKERDAARSGEGDKG